MKINTKFYSETEIDESNIINFSKGLPGFEEERNFVYIQPQGSIFGSLQSCDREEVAFVVISPYIICPDYVIDLDEKTIETLELAKPEDVLLLAIVNIPAEYPQNATVNLQAPIVINSIEKQGMQVISVGNNYSLRCKLWNENQQIATTGE